MTSYGKGRLVCVQDTKIEKKTVLIIRDAAGKPGPMPLGHTEPFAWTVFSPSGILNTLYVDKVFSLTNEKFIYKFLSARMA